MTAQLLDVWTRIRCLSRELPQPERVGDVLVGQVHQGRETVRHVILTPTRHLVASVVAGAGPGAHVKLAGDVSDWRDLFPSGWQVDGEQWLMTTDAQGGNHGLADGYRVDSITAHGRISVDVVHEATGGVAAHGQAGVDGGWYVPDNIVTEADHQRRGLGAAVMTGLAELAAQQGATNGLLVASPDGRGLYTALGWREISPVVAADFRP